MVKIKAACLLLILLAVTARVLWWTFEPLVPLALVGLGLTFVYSFTFRRKW